MKISVLPVSFFADLKSGKMSLEECAGLVAASGAQGIDLSPIILGSINSAAIKRARIVAEKAGLEIGMLVAYTDFSHPDPSVRKQESDNVIEIIRVASELEAQFVRLTAGQAYPETKLEEGISQVVDGLLGTLEEGRRQGVRLVFENHSKPVAWRYPDFAWPMKVFLEISRRTEGTELGILFDTANPVARGDDPLEILNPVINRVNYVHASDSLAKGSFEPVLLGTGSVPFDSIFARLKQQGYAGWISVEEASRSGPEAVQKAVHFVRSKWASVLHDNRTG